MPRQERSEPGRRSVARSVRLVVLLVGLSVVCGSAVAVTVDTLPVPSVRQTTDDVDGLTDVVVESHQVEYSGGNVSGVTVTLKNIGGELTVDLTVSLETLGGGRADSATASVLLSPTGTTTQTVSFSSTHAADTFARIRVGVQ